MFWLALYLYFLGTGLVHAGLRFSGNVTHTHAALIGMLWPVTVPMLAAAELWKRNAA